MSLFVEHHPRLPGGTGALDPLQAFLLRIISQMRILVKNHLLDENYEPWFVSTALVDDSFIGERKPTLTSHSFPSNCDAGRPVCRPGPGTRWKYEGQVQISTERENLDNGNQLSGC